MKFRTKTVIEMNDHSIKVFQASLTNNYPIIFGEMIDCQNVSDDGRVQKLLNVGRTKGFFLQGSQIILSIPRQYVITRYLDLPSSNMQELRSMVDLQVGNHIPYSREEVIIDFVALHKGTEGYTKVLMVAVPRDLIMRYEAILQAARMNPHKISVSWIGQWQWFLRHYPLQQTTTVLVDIDSHSSEMCFCDQTKVFISRPVTLGVKEIESKHYEEFLVQLDATMAIYVKEQLGPPIGQIILLSSDSHLEELKDEFQKQYKVPVISVCTLDKVALPKNGVWPPLLLSEKASITSILGFLQTTQEPSIDLIPSEIKMAKTAADIHRQGIRLGVVAVMALLSIGLCLSLNFIKNNSRLSDLEGRVKEAKKQVALINQKKDQIQRLRAIIEGRVVLADILGEIYNVLPSGVVLTNLSLDQDHHLSLQGYTARSSDINDMQKSFVSSSYFDNVNLDYVNKRVTMEGELNYFKITEHIRSKGLSNDKAK
ncbi:MAG: pilus assembly protein PilM [Candidatus Omnitrophica bacterium]|nr:pilus assembly protein PilM [Candidatus Omnitrophota bacterium]